MVRPLLFVGKRVSETAPALKKQKTNTKDHKKVRRLFNLFFLINNYCKANATYASLVLPPHLEPPQAITTYCFPLTS